MQNTHDRHVHLNYQVTRAVSSKWVYTTNYIYYISTSNYNIFVQFVEIKCADHDLTLQTEFEKTTSKFCKIVLGESKRSHSLAARLGALGRSSGDWPGRPCGRSPLFKHTPRAFDSATWQAGASSVEEYTKPTRAKWTERTYPYKNVMRCFSAAYEMYVRANAYRT